MNNGDIIGKRYKIIEHIGQGGMQNVFLANDLVLNNSVALKAPLPGQQDKRFNKSAIISAKVNHHNVAKTLDYLETSQGIFLVEEYVKGEDLESRLNKCGLFDPHQAARVFLYIAKGVAASHHAGVVHRDLKPSNIIVNSEANLNQLKITDFGIATLADELFNDAAEEGDLTKSNSGTIKGALPYMSPEMMFRKPGEHPGKPSDVWSLGALMFQLLVGEVPFGYYLQAAVNVQNQNRTPWPNFMSVNMQFKPLAEQLKKLVEQCLEYLPDSRPTADQLVKEISNLCYIGSQRHEGYVNNIIQNGYSGFIDGEDGSKTFFSMDSVYGNQRPVNNSRVSYSRFPGSPYTRGHPIVVLK